MRKQILVALALLTVPAAVSAQNTANQSVTVTAQVIRAITLSASGALNFGPVVAGGPTVSIAPSTSASAVTLTVGGEGGQNFAFSWLTVAPNLAGTSLTFSPAVIGGQALGDRASNTGLTSGSTYQLSGALGGAGNYYVWLGGDVSAPAGTAPGVYTGSMTFTATYN